jgi:cytochrome c553
MPGSSMPAFEGLLSDEDIAAVVSFILDLGPSSLAGREAEALSIPEFPAADASSLADGRALYLILGCWKCHGLDGSGRGPSAKGLKSDEGQPIRPRDFRYDPFKSGRSPETVARAALSGLIGTPMPSHAEIMAVPREAIDSYAESIPAEARTDLEDFRHKAPPAVDLLAMDDEAWEELRDRNLVSLAHYVLSLSRRDRVGYRLFRQRPELEGRQP